MSRNVPETTQLTADDVIAHLRGMSSRIGEVSPLTREQRRQVLQHLRNHPPQIVEATINVIGVLDNVSAAVGQALENVRRMQDDTIRWEAAADEARAFLKGLEGANLIRRQQLAIIATQAYAIATQLAKDPEKAVLRPHVEEVRRLKSVLRRRRATQDTEPSEPAV